MPYTPPSHRSPASSASSSPSTSRRSSFQDSAGGGSRPPLLPRSSSYLTKHRRTPSFSDGHSDRADRPCSNGPQSDPRHTGTSSSVRQSPPPVTNGRIMPKGAILSPPASPPESPASDEEGERGRQMDDLRALHDAISRIPQHRESSPTKTGPGDILALPSQAPVVEDGLRQSLSTSALSNLALVRRKAGHARSVTEPNALLTSSEDESEEEVRSKPQMVRKKSGELVRPALRASSHRRPSSMPGTPTFSKAVHFDSHLEHVRHFLQVDRPVAVSAGSSPVDSHDSDNEYPFSNQSSSRSPPFEWQITVANFPVDTPARKAQHVRLERVWLSNDQKCLIGSVVVANIAFQKHVTCRFTLDYWKTTSEVSAEYFGEAQSRDISEGRDRFHFTIKLSDISNLGTKTLYFCIRYNVAGQELWDNNTGMNFRVDFEKKFLPRNGKKGAAGAASRPAGQLPRSSRRSTASAAPEPKPKTADGRDGFNGAPRMKYDPSVDDYLGEPESIGLKFKSPKPSANTSSDNHSSRPSAPSGQAFANRYDFGASLSAAVKAGKGDAVAPASSGGLYMKSSSKGQKIHPPTASPHAHGTFRPERPVRSNNNTKGLTVDTKPQPSASGQVSLGGTSIASSSYEELVNKYCFFGSKPRQARADDTSDNSRSDSSAGSPLPPAGYPRRHRPIHNAPPDYPGLDVKRPATVIGNPSPAVKAAPSVEAPQPRPSSALGQPSSQPPVPSGLASGLTPLADTQAPDLTYQPLSHRYPFSSLEAHAATEIRG